jgi:hypothetical protein
MGDLLHLPTPASEGYVPTTGHSILESAAKPGGTLDTPGALRAKEGARTFGVRRGYSALDSWPVVAGLPTTFVSSAVYFFLFCVIRLSQ